MVLSKNVKFANLTTDGRDRGLKRAVISTHTSVSQPRYG